MRLLYIISLVILTSISVQAQLQQATLSHNLNLTKAANPSPPQKAVSRSEKGAALPFFDDFAYAGPYPDGTLWTDRHVFINNTLAYQPVSIGVATFDGLDATGSPYGGLGSADTLTSISLDLSGSGPKYLSYYVQPKGLGDAPGPEDKLVLEFKNAAGEWIEVKTHAVTVEESFFSIDSLPRFEFIEPIAIREEQYLYADFQFRFRNFALRNGAVDLWHLDYVRLETEPTAQNTADLAFTTLPSNILLDYSSAPWNHIREAINTNPELILTTYDVNLFNHSNNTISTGESELLINGNNGDEIVRFRRQTLVDPSFGLDQVNITSGRHIFTNPIRGEYRSAYRNEFKSSDKIEVKVDYSFEQNNAEPETTKRNNQVSRIFDLDNYYAYDDGSSESALFIGTGGQVAVKFTNYKADMLQAIRIHIPRIVGGIDESNFTLKVWLDDLNTEPVFEQPFNKPLFIDEFRDSLQAFTTYVLKDNFTDELTPVELPVGDFYIGWEQVTSCNNVACLPVGLDRNSPAATGTIFVSPEGNWGAFADFFPNGVPVSLTGALMIRPVVGSEPPRDSEDALNTSELILPQLMNIFPNPTNGMVNIQLFENNYQDFQLIIRNTLGQTLHQQTLSPQLELMNQIPGIYFLQFINKNTRAIGNYKLVIR